MEAWNHMQDMLLEIEMIDVEPRIWRRFRVSGAISLRTLQDKVPQSPLHSVIILDSSNPAA